MYSLFEYIITTQPPTTTPNTSITPITVEEIYNNSIILSLNSITALVNGERKILQNIRSDGTQDGCYYPTNQDPQAYGTTLVPLRFISENLGGIEGFFPKRNEEKCNMGRFAI